MTTVLPQIQAVIQAAEDPTFEGGSAQSAVAVLSNPTTAPFTFDVELYLDVLKAASSGIISVAIPAGGSTNVPLAVIMPGLPGTYQVYLDVKVNNVLIGHFLATEDVVITVTPDIDLISITW